MTDLTMPDRLVARTVEVAGEPLDLVAFAGPNGVVFEQEGHGLAGRGVAARIDLPRGLDGAAGVVADFLSSIEREGAVEIPGTGPVAVGALPFDRAAGTSMVVPAQLFRRTPDGRQWRTTVMRANDGAAPDEQTESVPDSVRRCLPDGFTLRSPRPHGDWESTVADAVKEIADGRLAKVVVAREVVVEANRSIVVPDVLERLRALYPACVVFLVDGFLGASPELLVERTGRHVRSHPLAGTFPRSGDPHADVVLAAELVASVKDQREHRFVIEAIDEALRPLCADLDVPDAPSIMQLRNVLHLGTEIDGHLLDDGAAPSALALVERLHPTPAVAGTPTDAALAWLGENEGLARGRYAGPVGWVDAEGDGSFSIGIRSAEIHGSVARLFAGVGIVEGSDPRRELVETQLKLQALLAALVRP